MSNFVLRLAGNFFFPVTLSYLISFFGQITQSELEITNFEVWGNSEDRIDLFTLGSLLCLTLGMWVSINLYFAILGLANIARSPFPGLDIFFLNFSICTILSFSAPFLLPPVYNALAFGFGEAFIGLLAHIGFYQIFNARGVWLNHIPFTFLTFVGAVVGISLRIYWFYYKGV